MTNVPDDLLYSKEHEWVRLQDDHAYIGITEFAQAELGDIVFVELPEIGTEVKVGETLGTVESVKTVSDLYTPVAGTVMEVNEALADVPERVSEDPYDTGWMVVLAVQDVDRSTLLTAEQYREHIGE